MNLFQRLREDPWHVARQGPETIIRLTWRRRRGVLAWVLFWVLAPAFCIIALGLVADGGSEALAGLLLVLPLLLFFWYFGRLYWRNYTYLHITPRHLRVTHGPVWWPGRRTLSTPSITGFEIRETKTRVDPTERHSGRLMHYHLFAQQENGKARLLSTMSHFTTRAAAEACAEELTRALARTQDYRLGEE